MPRNPQFVDTLCDALVDGLERLGIQSEVHPQRVRGTRMHRFYVIADGFEYLRHSERQSVVWRIAEAILTDAQLNKISMILTLTPDELGDDDYDD